MSGKSSAMVSRNLPLSDKRIVITRARLQAGSLARRIEELGGEVVEFPTIEIQLPVDPGPLDDAIKNIQRYNWVIFTSVNGVATFLERTANFKKNTADFTSVQFAAIGPETAKRLEEAGIKNCLVPTTYRAEGILEVLQPETMRGRRVLIPRAARAREVLPETLRQWGADVDVVAAYRTIVPKTNIGKLQQMLSRREIDMVTFTSSSTVANFAALFDGQRLADILGATPVACIGPITADTVEEFGGVSAVLAREFTIPGLVCAIVEYFQTTKEVGGK
jgi:uroporphyrinogen III methyltransferase/synthase